MTTTPTRVTEEELAKWEALARKATPGEWRADSHGREFSEKDPAYYAVEGERSQLPIVIVDTLNCSSCLTLDEQRANAYYIASLSPSDILRLIASHRALEKRVEAAEAALTESERNFVRLRDTTLAACGGRMGMEEAGRVIRDIVQPGYAPKAGVAAALSRQEG